MPPSTLTPLRGLILLVGYLPLLVGIALWIAAVARVRQSRAAWEALPIEGQQALARRWDRRVRRLAALLVCGLGLALASVVAALLVPSR